MRTWFKKRRWWLLAMLAVAGIEVLAIFLIGKQRQDRFTHWLDTTIPGWLQDVLIIGAYFCLLFVIVYWCRQLWRKRKARV